MVFAGAWDDPGSGQGTSCVGGQKDAEQGSCGAERHTGTESVLTS